MPNIYSKVQNGDLRLSQLTENQYNRYLRQKERAGESHDYMKNFNLAAIPGAVNNVFTGTTTVGDGYIWDAPTTGQEDGWKIASNVLGLGDSLYELAHPAYSDPNVQNYINQNKGIIDTIGANVNAGIGATTTSGLMDLINNSNYASTDYDLDQLGNDNNVGKTIGGIGKAMLKGAESGSIGGPWGALGGAATGLITGIGAAFSGAKNKKADAINLQNQLKTRAAIANNRQSAAFQLGNSNIQSNNIRNQLMNNYNANSYGFAAYGGKLYPFGGALAGYGGDWTNGLTFINNGGTHEENPYEGVPVSIAQDGQPNLVEEGEVVWNDYVFSNRLEVPKEVMEQLKLGKGNKTFAEVVEKIQKEAEERPNDPIAKRGLEDTLQKLAAIQEQVRAEKEQQEAYDEDENTAAIFADGGSIHISKNKRGTFTAAAKKHGMGVQEFAKYVLAHKNKYSSKMVKKAVFAHNAKKWKHALGGSLENPPIDYVQLKSSIMDAAGNIKANEKAYIDSLKDANNRSFIHTVYNNGNGSTFYSNLPQGVNYLTNGTEVTPMTVDEAIDYRINAGDKSMLPPVTVTASYNPKYKLGGHLFAYGDPPITDSEGKIINDVRLNPAVIPFWDSEDETIPTVTHQDGPYKGITVYDPEYYHFQTSEPVVDEGAYITPKDPLLPWLGQVHPDSNKIANQNKDNVDLLTNYKLSPAKEKTDKSTKPKNKTEFDESWLRYAPAVGSAIGTIASLLDKPDNEFAETIERAGREAARKLKNVSPKPLGDYLAYNPFDRLFYANQLGAQAAAQRRAVENASNGNIGAALAALANTGYNANVALGQLYRQGEEYNLAQRQKVAEFNRGTNQFNSQQDLHSQIVNAQTEAQRQQLIKDAVTQAAALKLEEKNRIRQERSLNLTNFFDNLGNIGWEAVNRNMINDNQALLNTITRNGFTPYKGGLGKTQWESMSDNAKDNFLKGYPNLTKEQVDEWYKSHDTLTGNNVTEIIGG